MSLISYKVPNLFSAICFEIKYCFKYKYNTTGKYKGRL